MRRLILLIVKAFSVLIDFFIIIFAYFVSSVCVDGTIASLPLFKNDPTALFVIKGILTAGVATPLIYIKRTFLRLP